MWTLGYFLAGVLFLFWLPGLTIIMVLLYPVLLVGHALIFGSIDAARSRNQSCERSTLTQDSNSSHDIPPQDAAPVIDDVALQKRSDEVREQLRLQDELIAQNEVQSGQSFSHHHDLPSPPPSEAFTSWQDRLEAEAQR
jgi:hypothetical protein